MRASARGVARNAVQIARPMARVLLLRLSDVLLVTSAGDFQTQKNGHLPGICHTLRCIIDSWPQTYPNRRFDDRVHIQFPRNLRQ